MATRFNDFVVLAGGCSIATSFGVSTASITNSMISATAAIDADKLQHRHPQIHSQESNTTVAVGEYIIHVARGAGAFVTLHVGVQTAMVGAANCTVAINLNGTEITTPLTIDNSVAALALVADTGFNTTTLNSADVVTINTKTAGAGGGTLGKGFFAILSVDEAT